ncbi:patatin-like phospholipase family protein [Shewanella waksmanii]|uniref:patatin-like phospholipase family protein n=1 Tax=Shewanella waksmanii TaxID=213783 RepID=UPI00048A4C36|nr:patatin-like phospholipase family protein [Shewanella waksmanii]
MSCLRFLVGPTARKVIEQQGLNPQLFTRLLAASGGPKWIGIAALDRYIFSQFLANRQHVIDTLGASSGAWRLCCFAQDDIDAAYSRFEALYINQRYDTKPSPEQISANVAKIISGIVGVKSGADIVTQPLVNSHFIACRGRHLNGGQHRAQLAAGLLGAAASNLLSRRSIALHFQRTVFATSPNTSPFSQLADLPTTTVALTADNVQQVLVASGAIPWVIAPVHNISGAPAGAYFDGGISDYHFDIPHTGRDGLTLYPHFYPHMKPGWFDKALGWRRASSNYHDALVLAPSQGFIDSLPYGKLPDREDFSRLSSDERIQYWQMALKMSQQLADEFAEVVVKGNVSDYLEDLY